MPITCTTVAGAMAVTSQFKENLSIKLQDSIKLQKVPKQVTTYIKGPLRYNANTIVTYPKLPTQLFM